MSVTDAEREFYQSVLEDPDNHSLQDLRYAYFLAALNGDLPGGGGDGTVTSVNGIDPDEDGNVTIPIPSTDDKVDGLNGATGLWIGTQAEYDSIASPSSTVFYAITES